MVVDLTAPGANYEDDTYAFLGENAQAATVFKTFDACSGALDATYSKPEKDIGISEDGSVLRDNSENVLLTATCVRVY